MSNRWFSRVFDLEDQKVLKRVQKLPVRGVLGDGDFSYIEQDMGFRAILVKKDAWKLGPQTWYRRDIRDGLWELANMDVPAGKDLALVWSSLEELYDPGTACRILSAAEVLAESSLAWHWISYICRQPVRVQKKGGLASGVLEWVSKQRRLPMPGSP